MFTSINTSNSYYSYDTDQQQHPMLPNDVNPNYKQSQTFISSFSPFSPTYVDSNYEGNIQFFQQDMLMAHLLQQHNLPNRFSTGDGRKDKDVIVNVDVNASGGGGGGGGGGSGTAAAASFPFDNEIKDPARRRTSKKDRHSKIVTAKGPRDRRMRLSLDIARKFFSLQDMLGFDKASKTVDWLLRMSKAAIGELYKSMSKAKGSCSANDKSVSSPSEGEVISGIDEITNNEDFNQVSLSGAKPSAALVKEKRARQTRKPAFHPQVKEYRAMARARARERTHVKLWNRSRQCQEENHNHLQHMKSSSPLDKGEESGCHSNDLKSSIDMAAEIEPNSQEEPVNDIVDQSFAVNNGANQSSDFGYNHEITISQGLNSKNFSFPNFGGNWDIASAGASSTYSAMVNKNLSSGNVEQHIPTSFTITASDTSFQPQFADIQFCRPWESYQGL